MSGTNLYLISEAAIEDTVARIASMVTSRAAWETYLTEYWGDVRYSHETFVADAAVRRGSTPGSYFLAHSLVVNRPTIPSFFVGVEMDQLLLDFYWFPQELPGAVDEEARLPFEAQRSRGLQSLSKRRTGVNPFTGEPLVLPPRPASTRNPMESDEDLRRAFSEARLSDAVSNDLLLVNRLCNRRNRRSDDRNLRYPLWALCAWDNYEGYLTGAELSELRPPDHPGFLSAFRRAAALTEGEAHHQLRSVDVIGQARTAGVALGPEALCVAISSQ